MPPNIYVRNKHILNVKTIGRETSCDLVIEHTTASRQHARVELSEDGSVWVEDAGSKNGVFLHRNDGWIHVRRITLCDGDRVRFGDNEIPLQQLTGLFGKRSNVRLGEQHFPLRQGRKGSKRVSEWDEPASALQKPKRNPLTGRVEDER